MEKINLVELLKDCPEGMELDCTMYEDVCFYEITDDPVFPVRIKRIDGAAITLTKYGEYANSPSAKCVIFPKGKTTWEGFVPPFKFKDGDVITCTNSTCSFVAIFKEGNTDITFRIFRRYLSLTLDPVQQFWTNEGWCDFSNPRLATEEEKQKLFQAIKDNGYKWNAETKTLEKLVEPKFKVGDKITNGKTSITIGYIDIDNGYYYEISRNIANRLFIKNQDEWNLVPNKFDINTLKPFESKVLIRDTKSQKWSPAIWGFYDSDAKDYQYKLVGVVARYCIPYEGNEHLLGTTNDCDEFYRIWEKTGD